MFDFESESTSTAPSTTKPIKFRFDNTVGVKPFVSETLTRYTQLHERIETLMSSATVDSKPILEFIFRTIPDPDPEELKVLGEALIRMSKLYPAYKTLSEQRSVILAAQQHPEVLALAFGVYDDQDFTHLLQTDDTDLDIK
jgi:hypothetical protein